MAFFDFHRKLHLAGELTAFEGKSEFEVPGTLSWSIFGGCGYINTLSLCDECGCGGKGDKYLTKYAISIFGREERHCDVKFS